MKYFGGCHCGAVRFEVEAEEPLEIDKCNCTICSMSGYLHLIVPAASFRLLTDESALATYTFNNGVARHKFCKNCGIKSFYVPRSNPDGIDVNLNCLDTLPENFEIVDFDSGNWEESAQRVAHKSKPA